MRLAFFLSLPLSGYDPPRRIFLSSRGHANRFSAMVCADEFSRRSTILTAHSLSLRIILISSTQDFSRQVSTGPDGSHIFMTSKGVVFVEESS